MKKTAKLMIFIISIMFTGAMFLPSAIGNRAAFDAAAADKEKSMTDTKKVSVIFTHDMHSHMDGDKALKKGKVVEVGGFGRLKTAMESVKADYPDSFILDAGDFSMGTPYQTIFSKEASELKMMKYLGFEATTFGNHEFDYRAVGLASMLETAVGTGPQIVAANIDWDATLADKNLKNDGSRLKTACDDYGVKDYMIIDHNGIRAAVFGLMGENAVDYAPESGLVFQDANEAAKEVVDKIKTKENADVIICLSHCGTIENETDKMEDSEDYLLAKAVPDIDLIISGHSHTVLDEPVQTGETYIVSCGSYNTGMGHIVLEATGNNKSKDGNNDDNDGSGTQYKLQKYEIVPLDENVKSDADINSELAKYKKLLDTEYFNDYGYDAEQVIASNDIDFTAIEEFSIVQGEDALGNLITDSYKYAVAQAENGSINDYNEGGVASGEVTSEAGGAQIAIVPAGVVRGTLMKGEVTVADAFNISSLGYGKDGRSGYPLVRAYLTGKELKAVAEVDASVSNFMGVARLYSGGLEYSWNPNRLILNRAVDIMYNDGENVSELEDEKSYSVIADLYSCQMLGTVKDQSFGLLKIEPKDKDGNPITNFEDHIIYNGDREVKAWYALASYIDSFDNNEIPEYYSNTHERKTEIDSKSPAELLKQPNNVAWIVLAVVIVLILIIVGIVVLLKRRRRRKRV